MCFPNHYKDTPVLHVELDRSSVKTDVFKVRLCAHFYIMIVKYILRSIVRIGEHQNRTYSCAMQ